MYKDKWRNYFFPAKPIGIPGKWTLLRQVGRDILSEKAQEKLERIIFYNTIAKRNVAYTASYFGINPKTLYKWIKRFDEKNLHSLEERSRRPQKTRGWLITREEANKDLTKWLIKYNSYRPHQALDYKTPLEYAEENFFKVLPMWSARTRS